MLGIFLIICIAVYYYLRFKQHCLLKQDFVENVKLNSIPQEYKICNKAIKLDALALIVILIGYLGGVWPYAFVKNVDTYAYIISFIGVGVLPILFFSYLCYLSIKTSNGYIKINIDQIEYCTKKSFIVKSSDIKKISHQMLDLYQIHLKEKGKQPLKVDLGNFHKKEELCSLIKQFGNHCDELSGHNKSFFYMPGLFKFNAIVEKYGWAIHRMVFIGLLLYSCYCCIDYDLNHKDYVAEYNAIGAIPNKTENAWPSYIEAATNYVKLSESLQTKIADGLKYNNLNLNKEQIEELRKWHNENTISLSNLKKAASIDYCNATYENTYLSEDEDKNDFSSISDNGYRQIKYLYCNMQACYLFNITDIKFWDIFEMQLSSAKHFTKGKSFIDQLVGYAVLKNTIHFLANKVNYSFVDLEKTKMLLKKYFPDAIPPLNIDGEVFVLCDLYDQAMNFIKIPVQTPFNPMLILGGSATGLESSLKKRLAEYLEKTQKGIKIEDEKHSFFAFLLFRNQIFSISGDSFGRVYKVYKRASAHLSAAYFLLDLEEYKLTKGRYPADVSQIKQADFNTPLPDDIDSGKKIIYQNDGKRAVLYAVGKNKKDDGGYKDPKDAETKRDDTIYWQRDLTKDNI